jgi:small-conductance mechanosensitive channel
MVDLGAIKRRYTQYSWSEQYEWVRYLSIWFLIFGAILILTGVALSLLLLTGRLYVPYASTTRILLSTGIFLLGLLLGSGLLAISRMLAMVRDVERSTRFAMNIWFILEERDLGEIEEVPEEIPPVQEEAQGL